MRLRILSAVIVVLIAALAYVAWNKNTQSAPPNTGMPGSTDAAAPATGTGEATMPPAAGSTAQEMVATPTAQDPGVAWEKPGRWVEELASGMRLATYVIPAAAGSTTASCAVYYFGPGQGGGTDANIERWIGEFDNPGSPVRCETKVRGMNVTQV